jgi:hypothetical protein
VDHLFNEFFYSVFGVPEMYSEELKVSFNLSINFYYAINKLIILVPDPHEFGTSRPPLKISLISTSLFLTIRSR